MIWKTVEKSELKDRRGEWELSVINRLHEISAKGVDIVVPMLATGVIAFLRRDARYLLGWVVTLPWLMLNFTAYQDVKAALAV